MGWKIHSLRAGHGGLCDMAEIVFESDDPTLTLSLSERWGDGAVREDVAKALAGSPAVAVYAHAKVAAATARQTWEEADRAVRRLEGERAELLEAAPADLGALLTALDEDLAVLSARRARALEVKEALAKASAKARNRLLGVVRVAQRDASLRRMDALQRYKQGLAARLTEMIADLLDEAASVELALRGGVVLGQLGGDSNRLLESLADAHKDEDSQPAEVLPEIPPELPAETQAEAQPEPELDEVTISCPG